MDCLVKILWGNKWQKIRYETFFLKKKIFFININSKNELTVKHKIIMIMITVIKHA